MDDITYLNTWKKKEKEDPDDLDLESLRKENQEKAERMERDRKAHNKEVLRAYRIKKK